MCLAHGTMRRILAAGCMGLLVAALCTSGPADAITLVQRNLVSDIPGVAATTDANLVNPWGIASSASSPFWVSDNRTGLSTLYKTSGTPQALDVTIPPPALGSPPSAPTGVVFNATSSDFAGAHFLFSTEDGTISGWASGSSAILRVDMSATSVFKGLAFGLGTLHRYIYATDFRVGQVDAFDESFTPSLAGAFADPGLPAGYAPFGIQNLGGKIYVSYAVQDGAKHDDVSGPGNGIVDVFTPDGLFVKRLISNGALNSPWGMAIAPPSFADLAGDLLVGNFGDGRINAFDPITGALIGPLLDTSNNPIVIEGLWGLRPGNGGTGGDLDKLYFTAGIPGSDQGSAALEDHGLFGSLEPVPEPATISLLALGALALLRRRRKA